MPIFKVWWPLMGQQQSDGAMFQARDEETAASRWGEWYDGHSAEYSIVGGQDADVLVLADGGTDPVKVTVVGEMTRSYRARPAKEPKP